jgi:hypothetical protein
MRHGLTRDKQAAHTVRSLRPEPPPAAGAAAGPARVGAIVPLLRASMAKALALLGWHCGTALAADRDRAVVRAGTRTAPRGRHLRPGVVDGVRRSSCTHAGAREALEVM